MAYSQVCTHLSCAVIIVRKRMLNSAPVIMDISRSMKAGLNSDEDKRIEFDQLNLLVSAQTALRVIDSPTVKQAERPACTWPALPRASVEFETTVVPLAHGEMVRRVRVLVRK